MKMEVYNRTSHPINWKMWCEICSLMNTHSSHEPYEKDVNNEENQVYVKGDRSGIKSVSTGRVEKRQVE